MYKFIVYPLLIVILLFANLDLLSNHASLIHYYKYKYAINRATHAAAMQINKQALAEGNIVIDEYEAYHTALQMLELNLEQASYSIKLFEVIQLDGLDTPYHYTNKQWNIDLYLYKPAIILVVETKYPHIIASKSAYEWKINGTSEVVTSF